MNMGKDLDKGIYFLTELLYNFFCKLSHDRAIYLGIRICQ